MKRTVLILLAVILLLGCMFSGCAEKSDIDYDDSGVDYDALGPVALKTALLKKAVLTGGLNQKTIGRQMAVQPENGPFVVYLSWCDGKTQADVLCGTGDSVEAAYDAAAAQLPAEQTVAWLKADVVVSTEAVSYTHLDVYKRQHTMWGWPLPAFLEQNHLAVGLAQLLLTVIVMVINQKFFISGFKSLWHRAPNMDTLVAMGSAAAFVYSTYVLFAMTDEMCIRDRDTGGARRFVVL